MKINVLFLSKKEKEIFSKEKPWEPLEILRCKYVTFLSFTYLLENNF